MIQIKFFFFFFIYNFYNIFKHKTPFEIVLFANKPNPFVIFIYFIIKEWEIHSEQLDLYILYFYKQFELDL